MSKADELASLLNAVVGQSIQRVKIACYLFQGHISLSDTPLQLELAGNSVVLLDGASDGESLRVRRESWTDPIDGDLSDENKAFIEKHGQWVLIDVSKYAPFERFINSTFDRWRFLANSFGTICGVEM